MFLATADEMRAAEAASGRNDLMLFAGNSLARTAAFLADAIGARCIHFVVGKGNNGGDAYVAAEALTKSGRAATVIRYDETRNTPFVHGGLVVDAVLGTGITGVPRGDAATAIEWINAQSPENFILSCDIPSGMNADTGECAGVCVRADATLTFGLPKSCFANTPVPQNVGHLSVAKLPDVPPKDGKGIQLIAEPELVEWLPARPWDSNKGTFGRVTIIGGSANYPHAPILSAMGAIRGGAGLVALNVPEESRAAAATLVPEAIFTQVFSEKDSIVLGQGLQSPERFTQVSRNITLDAGAFQFLAKPFSPEQNAIITPHPGEAARLLGCSVAEIQADRAKAALELAKRFNAVAVLKGAGTLVATPEGSLWLNRTGNPGMAKAGSGDVLAGLCGAFLAQGLDAFRAAALAVWVHGTAGDFAAWKDTQVSSTARAIAENLPLAFRFLRSFKCTF